MTVKDHIRGKSEFLFYRKGNLFYQTDDTKFIFVVPVEDTGDASFSATEKSMHMMRYIRKQIEDNGE